MLPLKVIPVICLHISIYSYMYIYIYVYIYIYIYIYLRITITYIYIYIYIYISDAIEPYYQSIGIVSVRNSRVSVRVRVRNFIIFSISIISKCLSISSKFDVRSSIASLIYIYIYIYIYTYNIYKLYIIMCTSMI